MKIEVLIGNPYSNWKIDDQKNVLNISKIKNISVEIIKILITSWLKIAFFWSLFISLANLYIELWNPNKYILDKSSETASIKVISAQISVVTYLNKKGKKIKDPILGNKDSAI